MTARAPARTPARAAAGISGRSAASDARPQHPIRVAALRSGLTPQVLRAWERRYGVVSPNRSSGGRRLYSDADVARLRLMREATVAGRRIGELAALPPARLEQLVRGDRAAARPAADCAGTGALLAESLAAASALDGPRLEAALARALIDLPAEAFVDRVAAPLMRELGEGWLRGELTPAHEHLASAVLRRVLGEVTRNLLARATGPRLVVATPSGQHHEIGAMIAALAAALAGWRVTYLGPDLPAADLARAAREVGAAAVALSLTILDAAAVEEIRTLRRLTGKRMPILLGGRAMSRLDGRLDRAGVLRVRDVPALRAALNDVATSRRRAGGRRRNAAPEVRS
jgi:DNA-binding transcriptional MerR regulator/methylmalonyl-CoA mutase cobalamin-binding subunit